MDVIVIIKIIDFQGELMDILAKTKALPSGDVIEHAVS